jgi:hypothetical protein
VLLQRALLDDLLDDGLLVVGAELVLQRGVRGAVEAALGAVPGRGGQRVRRGRGGGGERCLLVGDEDLEGAHDVGERDGLV